MSKLIKLTITLFIAIACLQLFSLDDRSGSEFEEWKKVYAPQMPSSEAAYRAYIFAQNIQKINAHNSDPTKTYKMGVNQFTAMTQQEFAANYLKPRKMIDLSEIHSEDLQMAPNNQDIDWTLKGMVSPVKNQGHCGSCWAFSAIGTLESYSLMKGQSKTFSEQQLVDCSHLYGNLGCDGGQNFKGLSYIKDHGIVTDQQYPYVAKNQFCKIHGGPLKIKQVASAKGCPGIQNAVYGRPIGVAVDAANWSHYQSGIFNDCKSNYLDHNVLLVGVTDKYWKIKNSWGTGWGERGYIRLSLGNTCGICNDKSPWPV